MKNSSFKYFSLFFIQLFFSCTPDLINLSLDIEDQYQLTTEKDLENKTYLQAIDSFYNNGNEGYFIGKAEVNIYYKIFEQNNSEKAIVISTGRTEAAIKYKELIYDLYQNGYSVYIHDHRGQGLSDRMTKNSNMGYIDDFQYYIDDFKSFFDRYVQPKEYDKTYLLAHSMGGAIALTYLEQNPKDFNAAAFSSPMLGFSAYITPLVKILKSDKPKYAIGQTDYNDSKEGFKDNPLTGCQLRYNISIDAYSETPKAKLGGATYHWLNASIDQFKYIFKNIDKIETPFILFSAENETVVKPYAHKKLVAKAKKLQKDCDAFKVQNAQHELFVEKDKQRIATLNAILDYYTKY